MLKKGCPSCEEPHVLSLHVCTPHSGALGHFFPTVEYDPFNCKYLQMYSRSTGMREPQM